MENEKYKIKSSDILRLLSDDLINECIMEFEIYVRKRSAHLGSSSSKFALTNEDKNIINTRIRHIIQYGRISDTIKIMWKYADVKCSDRKFQEWFNCLDESYDTCPYISYMRDNCCDSMYIDCAEICVFSSKGASPYSHPISTTVQGWPVWPVCKLERVILKKVFNTREKFVAFLDYILHNEEYKEAKI